MQAAFDAFRESMSRVRALHALNGAMGRQVTAIIDFSDILRAELVLGVSALDFYIHELVRIGMIECWSGSRKRTDAFERFSLPMSITQDLNNPAKAEAALEGEIRIRHSFLAFQHPDRIADAVRLVTDARLWDEVGSRLGQDAKAVKSSLKLIVDRRNKIAHEADIDPSYPGQRWPIDANLVENALQTIDVIALAVFEIARK